MYYFTFKISTLYNMCEQGIKKLSYDIKRKRWICDNGSKLTYLVIEVFVRTFEWYAYLSS